MVVVYLGHGELEETHGGLRLCGVGVALQAVLERWCERGKRQWGGVEKSRARGRLL